mmetsp:Transcript_24631/g.43751  ORF Transcript_24631/g.43751 Transcript_24631/m.43751 type:complete len:2402 (-) Transcript_24631:235-7440(-)
MTQATAQTPQKGANPTPKDAGPAAAVSSDGNEPGKLSVTTMPPNEESKKLFTVLCNYLSLSQFELARTVIDQLFQIHPDRVVRALREIILGEMPKDWLSSRSVRSKNHLSWLAYVEYYSLHQRVSQSKTPYLPSVNGESADLEERKKLVARWEMLQAKMRSGGGINPLGFISHDVVSIEACEVRLDDQSDRWWSIGKGEKRVGGGGRWWLRMNMELDGKRQKTSVVQALGKTTRGCVWKETLAARVRFSDSKLHFSVTAHAGKSQLPAAYVGVCTLPLTQIRGKSFYHIWIPLNSVAKGGSSESGAAVGRLRIKIRWMYLPRPEHKFAIGTPRGDISWSVKAGLRARLLVFHAKEAGLVSDTVEVNILRLVDHLIRVPDQMHWQHFKNIIGAKVDSGSTSLAHESMAAVGGIEAIGGGGERNSGEALNGDGDEEPKLSTEAWNALRRVIRAVPCVGHGICELVAELHRRAARIRAKCISKNGSGGAADNDKDADKFVAKFTESTGGGAGIGEGLLQLIKFYAQVVGEMLLKREFHAACLALRVLVSNVHPVPKKQGDVTNVLRAFANYIHETDHNKIEAELEELVGIKLKRKSNVEAKSQGPRQVVDAYRDKLALKCRVYSALLTGKQHSQEFHLRQFCKLESEVVRQIDEQHDFKKQRSDGKQSTNQYKVPKFFHEYDRAIEAVEGLALGPPPQSVTGRGSSPQDAKNWAEREKARVREECLASFWCEYTRFCRENNHHMFHYPLKTALDCIRNSKGDWANAKMLLRPFPQLRALAILLAWDTIGHRDIKKKRELITQLWTNTKPTDPLKPTDPNDEPSLRTTGPILVDTPLPASTQIRLDINDKQADKTASAYQGAQCGEPRITRWCNRLAFYIKLVDAVLDSHADWRNKPQPEKDRRANQIFESLRKSSLLCALRDYLPDPGIDPMALLDLLQRHRYDWAAVGSECSHDMDLLRAYFAIRGVLSLVVENKMPRSHTRSGNNPKGGETKDIWTITEELILSMSRVEVQVLAVEKLFCLVFITRADVNRSDTKQNDTSMRDASNANRASSGAAAGRSGRGGGEDREFVASISVCKGVLEFLSRVISALDTSLDQQLRSLAATNRNTNAEQRQTQNEHSTRGSTRGSDSAGNIRGGPNARSGATAPPSERVSARLRALRAHVNEGLWRLSVLEKLQEKPTLNLMVAPLEVISARFLRLNQDIQHLFKVRRMSSEHHALIKEADCWHSLCEIVRKQYERRHSDNKQQADEKSEVQASSQLVAQVTKRIDDYAASSNEEFKPLRGFFFALDLALTFSHVLSVGMYRDILEYALVYLEGTSIAQDWHTTRRYEFYVALTRNRLAARPDPAHNPSAPQEIPALLESGQPMDSQGADLFSVLERFALYHAGRREGEGSESRSRSKQQQIKGQESSKDVAAGNAGPNALLEWVRQYDSTDTKADSALNNTAAGIGSARIPVSTSAGSGGGVVSSSGPGIHRLEYLRQYRLYFADTKVEPKDSPFQDDRILRFLARIAEGSTASIGSTFETDELKSWSAQQHVAAAAVAASRGNGGRDGNVDGIDGEEHEAASQDGSDAADGNGTDEDGPSLEVVRRVGALAQRILLPLLCVRQALPLPGNVDHMAAIGDQARKAAAFLPCFDRWVSWRVGTYVHALHLLKPAELQDMLANGELNELKEEDVAADGRAYLKILKRFLKRFSEEGEQEEVAEAHSTNDDVADIDGMGPGKEGRTAEEESKLEQVDENDHHHDDDAAGQDKTAAKNSKANAGSSSPAENLGELVQALRLADQHLDPASPSARVVVQELLERIIPLIPLPTKAATMAHSDSDSGLAGAAGNSAAYAGEPGDNPSATGGGDSKQQQQAATSAVGAGVAGKAEDFRARCILRLEDAERAAVLALSYLKFWEDAFMCTQVLFKLLAGLEGGHGKSSSALAGSVRRKYRICLYYQQLARAVPVDSRTPELKSMLVSWHVLEQQCIKNLKAVVETVIQSRQVVIANKIFELFTKRISKHDMPAPRSLSASSMNDLQTKLTNARAAADIARLLREGSPTRDRIQAIKQLQDLDETRVYVVAKGLLVQLESAHAIHVVVQYLKHHFERRKQAAGFDRKGGGKSSSHSASAGLSDKESAWFESVKVATAMLIALPKELQKSLLKHYALPNQILAALLDRGRIDVIARLRSITPLFASYRRKIRLDHNANNDPLLFLLQFGKEVLTLKRETLGKHVGFQCLEWCLTEPSLVFRVRKTVLECCNELSRRLASEVHKLLVMHLIQSLLRFFEARCLQGASEDIVELFQKYHDLAFEPHTQQPMLSSSDGKYRSSKPPAAKTLLYRICRVKFCMDDLHNTVLAKNLVDRLMKEDEMEIAEEVWVKCARLERAKFKKKKKEFEDKMRRLCADYHEAYEKRPHAS